MSRPVTVHIGKHVYEFTGRYWHINILGVPIRIYDPALIAALNAVLVEFRGRDSVSARDWRTLNKVMDKRRSR